MRTLLYHFVTLCVLFTSIDGAADIAIDGHPHDDGPVAQIDTSTVSSSSDANVELNNDHCEHCCHGHVSGISAEIVSITVPNILCDQRVNRSRFIRNLAQAPPTPPPNA